MKELDSLVDEASQKKSTYFDAYRCIFFSGIYLKHIIFISLLLIPCGIFIQ